MEGERVIGFGEASEESVIEHGFGAESTFFGGLSDEHEGTAPKGLVFGEEGGDGGEVGHVEVVTAGVHDTGGGSILGGCLDGGSVGETGSFVDGEGIEIGAEHDAGAGPIGEDADDAVTTDVSRHGVAGLFPEVGEELASLFFLEREFGVSVEPVVAFRPSVGVLIDPLAATLGR